MTAGGTRRKAPGTSGSGPNRSSEFLCSDAVPELCIEVLSRDRAYDRITKRLIYAEAGVREYWAVEQSGLVERWTGDRLDQSQEIVDDLTSSLLPGFSLDLSVLFHRAA